MENVLLKESAIKRLLEPEEVASLVAWLASSDAGNGDRRLLLHGRRLERTLTAWSTVRNWTLRRRVPCESARSSAGEVRRANRASPEASQRLVDVAGRARERQPHERTAALCVEIDAGRDRDSGVGQQLRAERQRVVGQMRHVGVDVERAVGRREPVDADLAQTRRAAAAGWRRSGGAARRPRRSTPA